MTIRTLARIALGVSVVATGVVALAAPAVAVNDAYLSPTTSAYTDQTAPDEVARHHQRCLGRLVDQELGHPHEPGLLHL